MKKNYILGFVVVVFTLIAMSTCVFAGVDGDRSSVSGVEYWYSDNSTSIKWHNTNKYSVYVKYLLKLKDGTTRNQSTPVINHDETIKMSIPFSKARIKSGSINVIRWKSQNTDKN